MIASSGDPQGAAMFSSDGRSIYPVFIGQLEDQHSLEVDAGALGDTVDLLQQIRRPLFCGGNIVGCHSELLNEKVRISMESPLQVFLPHCDGLVDGIMQQLAVLQSPLVGRAAKLNYFERAHDTGCGGNLASAEQRAQDQQYCQHSAKWIHVQASHIGSSEIVVE